MKKFSIFIIISIIIISIFTIGTFADEQQWYKFTFTSEENTIIDLNSSNNDTIYGEYKLTMEDTMTYIMYEASSADSMAYLRTDYDEYFISSLAGFTFYTTITPGESTYFDAIGTFEEVVTEENNTNSIYQSAYDLIVNYVYGNAELTQEMTLTTVTMATIACVFCMALPFILVLKFINLIMGK